MKTTYLEIITLSAQFSGALSNPATAVVPFDGELSLIDWQWWLGLTPADAAFEAWLSLSGAVTSAITSNRLSTIGHGIGTPGGGTASTQNLGLGKVVPVGLPVRKDSRIYLMGSASAAGFDVRVGLHFRR